MPYTFNPLANAGFQISTNPTIIDKTADYTLQSSDNNKIVRVTTVIPSLVTLPNNLFVGFQCILLQRGTGTLQYQEGNGATLKSFTGYKKLAGINAVLSLVVTDNSNGASAVWQVLRADSIAGAIAALPANFTEVFGHNFWDSTQLTTSGSNVTSVAGVGTNPITVNQASSSAAINYPATKLTRASGKTAISGGGLSSSSGVNLSAYSDFTQVFLAYHTYTTSLLGYNIFGGFYGSTGTNTWTFENGWTTNSGVQFQVGGTTFPSRHEWEDKNVHLLIITRISGVANLYIDGVLAGTGTFANALSGTGIIYNMFQSGGSSAVAGNMALMKAGFFDRGVSASEVTQLDAYYQSLFPADYKPTSLLSTNLWIYNSNSIGQGFYYGNANTPSAKLMQKLLATYSKTISRWYNISLGGISTTQMATDAPTYVDPFWSQCTGQSNLILHEGTNDILLNNLTGVQAYANLKSYWQGRKTAGCSRVFVGTILPRTSFNTAQNTARTDCNALIRSSAVSDGATAIIDFDNNSNLLDASNTTYYLDGIHPTLTGAQEMANTLANAIASYV